MPYIKSNDGRRKKLRQYDNALNAGELNYQIFYYWKHASYGVSKTTIELFVRNFLGKTPNYQKYNDMTGCLVRCAKEIQRRLKQDASLLIEIMESYDKEIDKYEDEKIKQNGDV